METALNKLKEYIFENNENLKEKSDVESVVFKSIYRTGELILKQIDDLLEEEKEQIINAFEVGYSFGSIDNDLNQLGETEEKAKEYYKQTYENIGS